MGNGSSHDPTERLVQSSLLSMTRIVRPRERLRTDEKSSSGEDKDTSNDVSGVIYDAPPPVSMATSPGKRSGGHGVRLSPKKLALSDGRIDSCRLDFVSSDEEEIEAPPLRERFRLSTTRRVGSGCHSNSITQQGTVDNPIIL